MPHKARRAASGGSSRSDDGARRSVAGRFPPVARVNFGPARVPSRESPDQAVELLLERGYSACEIDFESGFWMD